MSSLAEQARLLVDYRLRVLKLLEAFVKRQSSSPWLVDIIVPLVRLTYQGQAALSSRAADIATRICKGKVPGESSRAAVTALKDAMKLSYKGEVGGGHTLAGNEVGGGHTLAGSEVGGGHTLAGSEVGGGHTLAGNEVGGGHTLAGSEVGGGHTLAGSEVGGGHTLAGNEVGGGHTLAGNEVGGGHTLAGSEVGGGHTLAGSEVGGGHTLAGSEVGGGHTLAGSELHLAVHPTVSSPEAFHVLTAAAMWLLKVVCHDGQDVSWEHACT